MNSKLQLFLPATLAAAYLLAPLSVSANGLLRRQYVAAAFEHIEYESAAFDSSSGVSFTYNHPLPGKIDLGLDYRDFDRDAGREDVFDLTGRQVLLNATFVGPTSSATPYLRLGLGWAEAESASSTAQSFMHSIGVGIEWPARGPVSVTTYVAWTDSFDGDIDGNLTYGGIGVLAISDAFGVIGKLEGDDHYNVVASLGLLFQF